MMMMMMTSRRIEMRTMETLESLFVKVMNILRPDADIYTHTHTYLYTCIYLYKCVCVYMCVYINTASCLAL